MPISVIPDLSSIAFGNVASDRSCAAQITLQVIGFSFDPSVPVELQVTPTVTSPDGGAIQVFSAAWQASLPPPPTVYSQSISLQEGIPKQVEMPIVLSAVGVEPGDSISGSIVIDGPLFAPVNVPFTALVVGVDTQSVAVHLVLDCSLSMNTPLGGGALKRTNVMRRACQRATSLLRETDWLGVVCARGGPVEVFKPERFTGTHRSSILASFTGTTYNPTGSDVATALGASLTTAQTSLQKLCSCSPGRRGMIVMTDGLATAPVPPTETSFAIGVGLPGEVNATTLAAASSSGTFFLLDTNPNDGTEDAFLLDKYLIQAIAEIADLPVVFDPHGAIQKDEQVEIPFHLTELDSNATVLLLVDDAKLVDVDLHPARAEAPPRLAAEDRKGRPHEEQDATPPVKPPRCRDEALDFAKVRGASRESTDGYVALKIDRGRRADPSLRTSGEWVVKFGLSERARESGQDLSRLRYSVVILTRSELRFSAQVTQDHYAVGAAIFLNARVSEHGGPVTSRRARVFAQVRFPDGATGIVDLSEDVAPGRFSGRIHGTQPGVYRIRFRVQGVTLGGQLFHRELTYTAHVARCATPCDPRAGRAAALELPSDERADAESDERDEDLFENHAR